MAANLSVVTIGAALKSKENLGARMGDVMSYLYMATCALEKFEDDGCPEDDLPLVEWSCEWALEKAESAMAEFIPNYADYLKEASKKQPHLRIVNLARFLEKTALPKGRQLSKPSDALTLRAADIILNPGEARDRLTAGVFNPEGEQDNPIAILEEAFKLVVATDPLEKAIRKALKGGQIHSADPDEAVEAGVISRWDAETLAKTRALVAKVVNVDDFSPQGFK